MTAGVIIICALILCVLLLFVAMIYMRPVETNITDKSIDISEVLPIQAITDDVIVNGNGDLTVGYKMFLPEVFALSKEEALYIHERLEALFKMLPAGTVIHQQSFYYTGEYKSDEYTTNALISENLQFLQNKEVLKSYTNLYVTFTNSSKSSIRKSSSNTSLLRKFNYPFQQPFKGYEDKIKEMESFLLNFENGLSSISQFSIIKMDSKELNNAVYDYLNLSYNQPVVDATQESLNPLMITKQGDMKIGEQLVSLLSLTKEGAIIHELSTPKTGKNKSYGSNIALPEGIKSKCSMLYPVGLGLPFDHIVNVVIEITDVEATLSAIKSEKMGLNVISKLSSVAAEKQKEQKLFCDVVSEHDHQTTYTAFNVIVNAPDKTSLMRKIALVQQGYSFMNQSSCFVENAELCNLFFTNIPGNARANYRGFINTVEQAICYLQKDNLYISDLRGHIYSDRFGCPVKINLWNYRTLNNKNRVVIGPSGSGKSFWLNNYILQSYELGRDVMIIDIGGSYRSMIHLNRGKYFDSTQRTNFAFNPFLCERDKNGCYLYKDRSDKESEDDLVQTIAAVLSYIWKGQDPMQQAEALLLKRSITQYYEYVNNSSLGENCDRIFPCMITYRTFLSEIFSKKLTPFEARKFEVEELILLLEEYTEGDLSFLLNAKENVDIVNDRLIAFDMEEAAKQKYFPIVVILTLQMVIDKIKKRQGVAKELIIDEGLDFLKDEKFGEFIAGLYRTFRKKEGSITLAAQNVLFLKNIHSDIKDSILINCDTKIILDHSQYRKNYPDLQNVLSFSDDEITMIDSLQNKGDVWREFFIKLSNDKFVFRNEVSPFEAAAYDSKQSTVVRIRELFNETGSTYTAINLYLKERRTIYG